MTTLSEPTAGWSHEPSGSPSSLSWPLRAIGTILDDLRELVTYRQVLIDMVVQTLKVRYQRSVLGFLWSLLNPIMMMTTLAIVFSQLWRIETEGFAVYVFAGLVPWGFLNGSLIDASHSVIQNEQLIKKIYIPKLVFPLASICLNLVISALTLVAMFGLVLLLGSRPNASLILLPLVSILFAMFCLGLGLVVAAANTFFRDVGHLVTVFLQSWYFCTPIIYPIDRLGEYGRLVWLNPAYPYIQIFQVVIRDNEWPGRSTLALAALFAVASLSLGYAFFKSCEDRLVFRL